jgi:hypothetical protein
MTDETKIEGLPVAGYRAQSPHAIELVNQNKLSEEALLRRLDLLKGDPEIDQRWLALARTDIERGFMALNRAIFCPERVKL